MRMPGLDPLPLPEHLQVLRATVMALPLSERRMLMHRLYSDISRQNDQRHAEAHERAEQARRQNARTAVAVVQRPAPLVSRPRVRQLTLLEAFR